MCDTSNTPKPLKRIDADVRERSEALLLANGIYAFDNFGWLNAYEVDPEFSGHARWQIDPPADFDPSIFHAHAGRSGKPATELEDWKKLLAVSGADFEGLAKAARMSIGLFLVQLDSDESALFAGGEFADLHRMSALLYLGTASERLREFFIAAAFRVTQKQYEAGGGKERRKYCQPFEQAAVYFQSARKEIAQPLNALMPLALEILKLRKERNVLVHEISTSIGHSERKRLYEKFETADPEKFSFSEMKRFAAQMAEARLRLASEAIQKFADWYMLLIRAGNAAFIFENERRRDVT